MAASHHGGLLLLRQRQTGRENDFWNFGFFDVKVGKFGQGFSLSLRQEDESENGSGKTNEAVEPEDDGQPAGGHHRREDLEQEEDEAVSGSKRWNEISLAKPSIEIRQEQQNFPCQSGP